MPRYLVMRTLPSLDAEQLEAIGAKVVAACEQVDGMQWIKSHVSADGTRSFCEFIAPNPDACRRHAQLAGLPLDDVIPLGADMGPLAKAG